MQELCAEAWCFGCQRAVIKTSASSLWNIAGSQSGEYEDNTELEHLEMEHHHLSNWLGYVEVSWSLPALPQMQQQWALTLILSNSDSSQHINSQHFWPIIALCDTCMLHNKETTCQSFYVCFPAKMRRCDVWIMVCVSLKRDRWLLSVCTVYLLFIFFITNLQKNAHRSPDKALGYITHCPWQHQVQYEAGLNYDKHSWVKTVTPVWMSSLPILEWNCEIVTLFKWVDRDTLPPQESLSTSQESSSITMGLVSI